MTAGAPEGIFGDSPARCARPEFSEALFAAPFPQGSQSWNGPAFHITELATPSAGAPVFRMEGTVTAPLPLLAAMIRESDLGDLAGSLSTWEVLESQPSAPFQQRIFYVSKLPWPFRARAFYIGNWVERPSNESFALLSTSLDPDDAICARVGRDVLGDVAFSGYFLVPLAEGQTWLRRVIGIDLHLPMPGAILRRMLTGVYRGNYAWLNEAARSDNSRFDQRMDRDPLYATLG